MKRSRDPEIEHWLVSMPNTRPTAAWEIIRYRNRGDVGHSEWMIPGTFREPDPDFTPLDLDVCADAASWGLPDPRYSRTCRHGISPPEACPAWRYGEDCALPMRGHEA